MLIWVSEAKLEGLSALTGSGPAFVFVLIEAMIDSGIFLGFTQLESRELVLKTLEGAIKLLRETGWHPGELKWQVTSPGGTTISGLKTLEEAGIEGFYEYLPSNFFEGPGASKRIICACLQLRRDSTDLFSLRVVLKLLFKRRSLYII